MLEVLNHYFYANGGAYTGVINILRPGLNHLLHKETNSLYLENISTLLQQSEKHDCINNQVLSPKECMKCHHIFMGKKKFKFCR